MFAFARLVVACWLSLVVCRFGYLAGWQSEPCLVCGKLQLICHTLFAHRHYYFVWSCCSFGSPPRHAPLTTPAFCNSTFGKTHFIINSVIGRIFAQPLSTSQIFINFPSSKWSSLAKLICIHMRVCKI